jgi:hypothetical protein
MPAIYLGLWQQMPFVEMENLADRLCFAEISIFLSS